MRLTLCGIQNLLRNKQTLEFMIKLCEFLRRFLFHSLENYVFKKDILFFEKTAVLMTEVSTHSPDYYVITYCRTHVSTHNYFVLTTLVDITNGLNLCR